jgi:hypothetical protein
MLLIKEVNAFKRLHFKLFEKVTLSKVNALSFSESHGFKNVKKVTELLTLF